MLHVWRSSERTVEWQPGFFVEWERTGQPRVRLRIADYMGFRGGRDGKGRGSKGKRSVSWLGRRKEVPRGLTSESRTPPVPLELLTMSTLFPGNSSLKSLNRCYIHLKLLR